jgi:hypothetical protein
MAERCLDEQVLVDWLGGVLPPAMRARAELHVDHCPACRDVVAVLLHTSMVAPAPGDRPGRGPVLGERYELLDPLGRGGMGVVYTAVPVGGGPRVAVKMIRPGAGAAASQRFLREARLARALDHPNVVRTLDFGATPEGALFLAMELLDGEDLGKRLRRTGRPLAPGEAIRIGCAAAAGLAAAHGAGIVHRDVKPGNLFLCAEGGVKVLDFGLAVPVGGAGALTRSNVILGTPAFMAPEQALGGRDEDGRTDVWGLGATLYVAVALRHPFAAEGPAAELLRIVRDDPDPLPSTLPAGLRDAILRALQKEPSDRFQSMSLFAKALRGETTAARTVALRRAPASDVTHAALLADGVTDVDTFSAAVRAEGGEATALIGDRAVGIFRSADAGRAAVRAAEAARAAATAALVGVGARRAATESEATALAVRSAETVLIEIGIGMDGETERLVRAPPAAPAELAPAATPAAALGLALAGVLAVALVAVAGGGIVLARILSEDDPSPPPSPPPLPSPTALPPGFARHEGAGFRFDAPGDYQRTGDPRFYNLVGPGGRFVTVSDAPFVGEPRAHLSALFGATGPPELLRLVPFDGGFDAELRVQHGGQAVLVVTRSLIAGRTVTTCACADRDPLDPSVRAACETTVRSLVLTPR